MFKKYLSRDPIPLMSVISDLDLEIVREKVSAPPKVLHYFLVPIEHNFAQFSMINMKTVNQVYPLRGNNWNIRIISPWDSILPPSPLTCFCLRTSNRGSKKI
jgi:hypothetical protein